MGILNHAARAGALAALLGFGAASFALADGAALGFVRAGDPPGPQVGEDAYALKLKAYNEEVALELVNNSELALHDFVGITPEHPKKVVVLHFSSIDDERSLKDFTPLQKLYRRYADDGLLVIGVNVDGERSGEVVQTLDAKKISYQFPLLRDRFGVVARRYGLRHLPTVYVIDGEGRVVTVREGYSEDISEALESEVKDLLKR